MYIYVYVHINSRRGEESLHSPIGCVQISNPLLHRNRGGGVEPAAREQPAQVAQQRERRLPRGERGGGGGGVVVEQAAEHGLELDRVAAHHRFDGPTVGGKIAAYLDGEGG